MLQALASAGGAAMAPRHGVEYAKSERSECKLCGKKIAKGLVRLGFTTRLKGYDTTKWYHPDCYLTTDSNAAAVALAVDADKLEGFPTLKASDQTALKALTSRAKDEETANGEPSDSRSTKNMKDYLGSALAVPNQEGTSQAPIGSPARKRKVPPAIAEKLNQDEKEQVLRYDPESWETTLKAFSPSLLANSYKGAKLPHCWKAFSSVIFNEADDLHPSEKIAAFDFDGCLANTDVRRSGAEAWSLMYPSIPKKLQDYHQEGFKLVIFSNESNIERWTKSRQKAVDSKLGRLEAFLKVVKVPMQAFISCGKEGSGDACRKPSPGMWHLLERHLNGGVPIDKERSFYVGDAAGRKGDHSAADLGFAQAVDLKFYIPEDVFKLVSD